METDKEYLRERCIPSIMSESSGEYTLPDYNTDIKRLLSVNARAVPSSKFMDGETLECVGIVAFEVVYLDSENSLTHCELTTDYELKLKCNSETYGDAMVATRIKSFALRPVGPRRLSAKSTLESTVFITERASIGIEGDAFESGEPEVTSELVQVATAYYSPALEREYAEPIMSLEGVIADDIEILSLNHSMPPLEINTVDGRVDYSGEIEVTALFVVGDELPTHRSISIPIAGSIELDEMEEGMDAAVSVWVTSLTSSVSPTDTGVSVIASLITEACAVARGNESVRLITDCFLKDSGIENEYTDATFCAHAGMNCEQIELHMEFDRDKMGAQDLRNIIHTSSIASLTDASVEGEHTKIEGEIRLSVMACEINDEGMPAFVGLKLDVPFAQKVKNSCQISATDAIVGLDIVMCDVSLDSDKVYVDARINCSLTLCHNEAHRFVTSSHRTEETFESVGPDIIIYYPEAGESLFDVARSFHTSLIKLASDNSISESAFRSPSSPSSLAGVRKLIIK